MAYVGTHRALRPLPFRHPAITTAAFAAVLGIGVTAAGITMLGSSGGPVTPRTGLPNPVVAEGGTSPGAVTPTLEASLPSSGPEIAPASQESTDPTRTTTSGTTTRARRTGTVTTAAGAGTNVTSTRTTVSPRSTRTTTRAVTVTTSKPPVNVTTTSSTTTTTPPAVTTTTTENPVQPGGGGAGS